MMLYPSLKEAAQYLEKYPVTPVFYEVLSDTHTPIYIYHTLARTEETCFILESVDHAQQWGRYSFIGIAPKAEIKVKNGTITTVQNGVTKTLQTQNPLAYLQELLQQYRSPHFPDQPKLTGGLIGYFAYDTVRYAEPTVNCPPTDDLDMPDCHLFLYDEIIAFDHLHNKTVIILNLNRQGNLAAQYQACSKRAKEIAQLLQHAAPAPAYSPAQKELIVRSNISKQAFIQMVEQAKTYIQNGDIFQIVLSQRFEVENPPEPFAVYRMLRASNPSPYLYYFKHRNYQIAGASPEMLVNVTDGIVSTKPIAGTIGRGSTEQEDAQLEQQLLHDPKEHAEHTMLVDLGRNDVGKIAKFGTVEVTDLMHIERYSKVMHLVSNVKGLLREDKTTLDALAAVLPAGTLSGAPKVRAMQLIDQLENRRRGLYGGTVGYLAFDGNMDTCIAIRTVLFKENKAYVQAGAGIVADSVPEKEYAETQHKALAVINAMKDAAHLEEELL